jgi:Uma2 family endonuclease
MNEIIRSPKPHATTQAAEGVPRLKWTLEEFQRLSELGFFGGIDGPRERVELIDGELVPMNAKGIRHERVRAQLFLYLARTLPPTLAVLGEPGWRPGGDRYLEPEIIVCRAHHQPDNVPPAEVLLLIEVADTSLRFDTGVKANVYAALGVSEYWVVNAITLATAIHRDPRPTGYGTITNHPFITSLQPLRLPEMTLRLGDLGLGA